jgi:hypothetical protein
MTHFAVTIARRIARPAHLAALATALIALAAAPTVRASILTQDFSAGAEELLLGDHAASTAAGDATQSSSSSAPQDDSSDHSPQPGFGLDSPLSSGSTSSPGTSSFSAGAWMSFIASSAVHLDDDSPTTRLAICQSLSLPTPPGVDLLRPPQA